MGKITIPIDSYIRASQVFHWATKRHYQLWFTGQDKKRHRRSESVLLRLVKKGKLRSVQYGSKLIYTIPKKGRMDEFAGLTKVVHGLACTECLVRFWRSNMNGIVVPERFFFSLGSVPEWGIIYPNGKMLLFEFSTKSNFFFSGMMKAKLASYSKHLEKIEEKFNAKAVVVFVLDIPRSTAERYVGSLNGMSARSAPLRLEGDTFPLDPFFFTDYDTFKDVPIGNQLYTPIYIWGVDSKQYKLSENV